MTAIGERPLLAFALTIARISRLLVLAPLFSAKQFPARARGVCAVALAVGLTPLAMAGAHLPQDPWELAGTALKELLVGCALAFSVGAVTTAVTIAGSYIDTLIGFSFGSLIDPVTGS